MDDPVDMDGNLICICASDRLCAIHRTEEARAAREKAGWSGRSDAYIASLSGLIRLHQLMPLDDSRPEPPECDEIRDGLDAPWYAMTAEEQERLNDLSAELYRVKAYEAKGG